MLTAAPGAPIRASDDAFVRDGSTYATTNYGTSPTLQVKNDSVGYTREAYLKFDTTSVASGVVSAKLRLFGRHASTTADIGQVSAYAVTGSWEEETLTHATRPTTGTTALATAAVSGNVNQWYEWDLTSYVLAERAAGRNVIGIVLRATNSTASYLEFASDEASADRPQLVLT